MVLTYLGVGYTLLTVDTPYYWHEVANMINPTLLRIGYDIGSGLWVLIIGLGMFYIAELILAPFFLAHDRRKELKRRRRERSNHSTKV